MHKTDFSQYEDIPRAMRKYLSYYGPHFSKKLCEFAVSKMTKENDKSITPYTKKEVEDMLNAYSVKIKNLEGYDHVFVANMGKADYLDSSIPDEAHLAKYIKNVLDDPDGYDGIAFNRWYADTVKKGVPIIWEDML